MPTQEAAFPQLANQLSDLFASTKSVVTSMTDIFAETSLGSLSGVRGRIGKMREALRGRDSIDSKFDGQARVLRTFLPLGVLDDIVSLSCKHETLKEFVFSDGKIVKRCVDCSQFDHARKDILNPVSFDWTHSLKKAESIATDALA